MTRTTLRAAEAKAMAHRHGGELPMRLEEDVEEMVDEEEEDCTFFLPNLSARMVMTRAPRMTPTTRTVCEVLTRNSFEQVSSHWVKLLLDFNRWLLSTYFVDD